MKKSSVEKINEETSEALSKKIRESGQNRRNRFQKIREAKRIKNRDDADTSARKQITPGFQHLFHEHLFQPDRTTAPLRQIPGFKPGFMNICYDSGRTRAVFFKSCRRHCLAEFLQTQIISNHASRPKQDRREKHSKLKQIDQTPQQHHIYSNTHQKIKRDNCLFLPNNP